MRIITKDGNKKMVRKLRFKTPITEYDVLKLIEIDCLLQFLPN